MVPHHQTRWPPCQYMLKTFKKVLVQNQESFGAESWYTESRTQGLPSCSNDDLRLTFYLLRKCLICVPIHYEEYIEKLFSQNVLKTLKTNG